MGSDSDPIVKVREAAFGHVFEAPNSVLNMIVRELNAKIMRQGFLRGREYKEIICKYIGYRWCTGDSDILKWNFKDIFYGFIRQPFGQEAFSARVMWVQPNGDEWKAVGQLTCETLEPMNDIYI